jgi:hypothetical protein
VGEPAARRQAPADGRAAYPAWARYSYALFVAVLVPAYWRAYGPGNFLWFSDIALFATLLALWTGSRLIASMMAVGVLPLELAWSADFLTGGNLIGLAAYMFDEELPLHLRGLSLFHLFVPAALIWMLLRQGYDPRALPAQTALAWLVLPASFLLTPPEDNINWVHGVGPDAQQILPPLPYLGLYMLLLPVLAYLPTHWALKRLFPRGRGG